MGDVIREFKSGAKNGHISWTNAISQAPRIRRLAKESGFPALPFAGKQFPANGIVGKKFPVNGIVGKMARRSQMQGCPVGAKVPHSIIFSGSESEVKSLEGRSARDEWRSI